MTKHASAAYKNEIYCSSMHSHEDQYQEIGFDIESFKARETYYARRATSNIMHYSVSLNEDIIIE